jgi:hypothetical protein
LEGTLLRYLSQGCDGGSNIQNLVLFHSTDIQNSVEQFAVIHLKQLSQIFKALP